jgi:hypothetical protein
MLLLTALNIRGLLRDPSAHAICGICGVRDEPLTRAVCCSGGGRYYPSTHFVRSGWQLISQTRLAVDTGSPVTRIAKKKTRDRQRNPATGRRKTALGLDQAGPRLPVPIKPIGVPTARFRHNLGTAIENEREGRGTLSTTADAATTVRLRIGRTRFHDDAFIPVRLVTADGNFVKRRVRVLRIFHPRNSIFPGIWPRRRHSAALRSQ